MRQFFKILLSILIMIITVGEVQSSTVVNFLPEEMAVVHFQEVKSISFILENIAGIEKVL